MENQNGYNKSYKSYLEFINAVTFANNGLTVVSTTRDNVLNIWNSKTGKRIEFQTTPAILNDKYKLSRDGRTLAVIENNGIIKLFDVKAGEEIGALNYRSQNGSLPWIVNVAFSPNGKLLASSEFTGGVKLWSVKTRELIKSFEDSETTVDIAFSPDGKTLAVGSAAEIIKLYDIKSGRKIAVLNNESSYNTAPLTFRLMFSPDGKILAASGTDEQIKLWNIETGEKVKSLAGHNYVSSLVFSPDGKTLVSVVVDNKIKMWDVESESEIITFDDHTGLIKSVVFSPDNQFLASISADTLKLWCIDNEKPLLTMNFLNSGDWITTSSENRFDTNVPLEKIADLPWIIFKEMTSSELPEFKKFYYEPKLLKRILAGEQFTGLPEDSETKDVQRAIKIIEINPSNYSVYPQINTLQPATTFETVNFEYTETIDDNGDDRMITDEERQMFFKTSQDLNAGGTENFSNPQKPNRMVEVDIKIPPNEILQGSLLPHDYTIEMIINELVDTVNLSRLDENGREIKYILRSAQQNRILENYETVMSAQINDKDFWELLAFESYSNLDEKEQTVFETLPEKESWRTQELVVEEQVRWKSILEEHEIDCCHLNFTKQEWKDYVPNQKVKFFFRDKLFINLREYTKDNDKPDENFWCEAKHFGYIVQGKAELDFGIKKLVVRRGDAILIPAGRKHQIRLLSKKLVVFYIDE